jgi:ribosomal protein S18 acetylase RimI-like enzyme
MNSQAINTSTSVRRATSADRGHVISMISEFADYLNAIEPDEVSKKNLDYLADLSLGPNAVATCLLAELNQVPAGYVSFHPGIWEVYKALYVVSLFVRPHARRLGIGKCLMLEARKAAKAAAADRLVWFVWKKNLQAVSFYKALGGEVFDDNHLMAWPVTSPAHHS